MNSNVFDHKQKLGPKKFTLGSKCINMEKMALCQCCVIFTSNFALKEILHSTWNPKPQTWIHS